MTIISLNSISHKPHPWNWFPWLFNQLTYKLWTNTWNYDSSNDWLQGMTFLLKCQVYFHSWGRQCEITLYSELILNHLLLFIWHMLLSKVIYTLSVHALYNKCTHNLAVVSTKFCFSYMNSKLYQWYICILNIWHNNTHYFCMWWCWSLEIN